MMKRLLTILLLLTVLPSAHAGYLRALGPNIVDTTNSPVLLRGVGLGGWLVPEGYMLHTPGYGSPTDIEWKIRDLIGESNTSQFYQLYRGNYVNRNDIQLIASWGFNSIRLPFHYKILYDSTSGSFRSEGFAILDSLIDWCEQSGMFVILDMHCAPGGQNKDNISDSDGIEARLWTDASNQALTIRIWKEIARRYVGRTIVAGYDLLNEPVLPSGYSNSVLRNFYKKLTDSIRTVDPNHIVFIEGNWYATDFNLLTPPFVTNMVYSFHKYWNETSAATIQYMVTIRTQYLVPLWLGESGENSNPWFYETVKVLEQYNIGWAWWTHKKVATITSPLSSPITPEYQTVLNYWGGSGPRPTEAFATNALFQMAQNLAIDHCESRPGVVRALLDPEFGTVSKPFRNHAVPGIVDAVDYDHGTNGVAYSDTDYKNVGGQGGSPYNYGYQYRNDGVDIEKCQDAAGAAYNVAWINTGEWMTYTVNIAPGGVYRVRLRVAAQSSGGIAQLYLDNLPLTATAAVPQTGGWQTWTTMTFEGVNLPAGTHQILVAVVSGGFNLNRLEFILVSTGVDELPPSEPHEFGLLQNYPNPFNPMTNVAFSIVNAGDVSLKVYDVQGKEVATLVSESLSPGTYVARFDAVDLAGGIYFCRLASGNRSATRKLVLLR